MKRPGWKPRPFDSDLFGYKKPGDVKSSGFCVGSYLLFIKNRAILCTVLSWVIAFPNSASGWYSVGGDFSEYQALHSQRPGKPGRFSYADCTTFDAKKSVHGSKKPGYVLFIPGFCLWLKPHNHFFRNTFGTTTEMHASSSSVQSIEMPDTPCNDLHSSPTSSFAK